MYSHPTHIAHRRCSDLFTPFVYDVTIQKAIQGVLPYLIIKKNNNVRSFRLFSFLSGIELHYYEDERLKLQCNLYSYKHYDAILNDLNNIETGSTKIHWDSTFVTFTIFLSHICIKHVINIYYNTIFIFKTVYYHYYFIITYW